MRLIQFFEKYITSSSNQSSSRRTDVPPSDLNSGRPDVVDELQRHIPQYILDMPVKNSEKLDFR